MRVLVIGLMIALAGCASVTPDVEDETVPTEPVERLIPVIPDPSTFLGTILNDHATGSIGHAGHNLHELHVGSHNLDLADFNDLSDGMLGYGSAYSEIDVVGDLLLVSSLVGSRGGTLVDISDPSNMQVLSHIYNMGDNWDARLSEDGAYLFLGCQGTTVPGCATVQVAGESPGAQPHCDGPSCGGGILIYDIEDPRTPVLVDFVRMGNVHNVYTFMKDSKHYFMNEGIRIVEWDPENGTIQEATTEINGVHDVAVQQHPITGDWLLYTGSGGMSIWNVTDPFNPTEIGVAQPPEGESWPAMWHEQTPMPCLIDGRHITIGAGESGGGVPAEVAVLDTTDPSNPQLLGRWVLPDHADITAQMMFRFSLHNVDGNCQGQVAIGHYHAGVWVFDISTPERMAEPATLGYYLPSERSLGTSMSPFAGAPAYGVIMTDAANVWATQWSEDGETLFIPDMTTGLYALTPAWEMESYIPESA